MKKYYEKAFIRNENESCTAKHTLTVTSEFLNQQENANILHYKKTIGNTIKI